MESAMIKGIWQSVTLLCGNNHPPGKEPVMTLQQGSSSLFYACPHYFAENRSEGDFPCCNRVSLKDFEGMLDEIFKVLTKADETNTVLNLTNYTWQKRGVIFKVVFHNEREIRIQALNRKALSMGRQ